ncbi:hypothetical protein Back2_06020 [Nocardioides baekrokdamisoli]|uniref:Uncharacterized protein n=1 Tax=Nocardioides baekrokdamisoli TaxID=1804624 RepID=A0A3G9IJS4_9ACTN|nr:hypothetical protein [Nocardioides baekrokdamisoli]BBH16315.1 hypothetical protein Back2_06020 [Nocardioides baekrokdamisoli]
MSTPVIVAAVAGAFVLGVLLGVVVAIRVAGRRIRAAVTANLPTPVEVPMVTDLNVGVPEPRKPAARTEYVITSVGEVEDEVETAARVEFKARPQFEQVARTVMIEAASLAHGVRNALSEENRAKISYEIKRELIRVRKDRKAEVKEALREYRARHRAPVDSDAAASGTGEGA